MRERKTERKKNGKEEKIIAHILCHIYLYLHLIHLSVAYLSVSSSGEWNQPLKVVPCLSVAALVTNLFLKKKKKIRTACICSLLSLLYKM